MDDKLPPPNPDLIERIAGLSLNELPPSLVWPGTGEAFRRGCKCPVAENQNRLRDGAKPKLERDCRVHNKVCQANACEHSTHELDHWRCEHCTNVLHSCVICEALYLEDGYDPSESGWVFLSNDSEIVKGWRCRRCR